MIASSKGNTAFVSKAIKEDQRYLPVYQRLSELCRFYDVDLRCLSETDVIWCRDYMPIQVTQNDFIRFNYNPSYLKGDPQSRPHVASIFWYATRDWAKEKFSSIKLDGGNVISNGNKTLMTSRIFEENPEFEKYKLIDELELLLETEIIIIPQVKSDVTGHVDGMVRFVDNDTLVGNHRQMEFKYWAKELNKVLRDNGLHYIDFPFSTEPNKNYPESAEGCYMNFLEISNFIFFPVFDLEMDEEALILMEQIFPDRIIEPIKMNEVARYGGVLNCITWMVQKPEPEQESEIPASDVLPF
ncbi:MAG: agmatine deiminase family protein [Luteibaculum sp.]